MRRAGFVSLALTIAVAGCGGLGSHDVELTVASALAVTDAALASVRTLEIGASSNGHGATMTYPLDRPLARVERVTIHVTNDQAPLDVGVIAHDSSGAPVAAATANLKLDGNGPHTLSVTLQPIGAGGQLFTITPASYGLFTGDTISFSSSDAVTWSVQEGAAGGSIDANGTYTAPAMPGMYTVVATSAGYFGHQVTASVQVLSAGVVNFAGALGGPGFRDGPLGTGRLALPQGLVSDGQTIFFTTGEQVVRKLDVKSGALTTLAGALNQPGNTDGTGAQARFSDLHQLALDANGNLYVADTLNHDIRKVEPATGQVTTFAGKAGVSGSMDGVGTAATFYYPVGVAWDGARTLFVGEACAVRKIDLASAQVTTLAGSSNACGHADGTGTAAKLQGVESIAYDGQGILWVAEAAPDLRKIVVATGAVTTLPMPPSQQIASDGNGALWTIASGAPGQVDVGTGMVTLLAAPGMNATGPWYFAGSTMAFSPDGGMYVGTDEAIYSLDPVNRVLTLVGGSEAYSNPTRGYPPTVVGPLAATRFNVLLGFDLGPDGIAYAASVAGWVAMDPVAGTSMKVTAQIDFPCCGGLRSDGKGTLYVLGSDDTLRSLTVGGTGSSIVAGQPNMIGSTDGTGSAARFSQPNGLALDLAHGTAYVADTGNSVIRKVELATGQVTTFLGTANMAGHVDDVGTAARLTGPRALVYDGAGTLYIGDSSYIRKATVPGGLVSTLAGSSTQGYADGPPGMAQFASPNGLVLDAAKQNLFVTDQLNNVVREVSLATGVVTTVAGQLGQAADAPGPIASATLNQPQQIALAPNGDLLVATPREQSILRIRLP